MKLTVSMRMEIKNRFKKEKISVKEEAFKKRETELAHRILDAVWEQCWPKEMPERSFFPEGILPKVDYFRIYSLPGYHRTNGIRGEFAFLESIPFQFYDSGAFEYTFSDRPAMAELKKELVAFIREKQKFEESSRELLSEFDRLLFSVTTDGKLRELYPEIDRYYDFKNPVYPVAVTDWKNRIAKLEEAL